jgi:hypothetical protein
MNFELINNKYSIDTGPVVKVKDHPLMDGIVISLNFLDNATIDMVLLENNDRFDIKRDISILEDWVNELFSKIINFYKTFEQNLK